MPNFDGNGPLKRGRIIGRGQGPCKQTIPERPQKETKPKPRDETGTSA